MSSSSDRDNLAKRRRIHKEESPTPPVSHFSERSGPNDNLTAGTSHEEGGCDDTKSEREDTGYDESSEPFPDCPAFDPAVQRVNGRVEEVTKKLSSILEQYSSINRHTKDMKSRYDKTMELKAQRTRVALLGATGAGNIDPYSLKCEQYADR
jgi:hypothetical protein